MQSMRNEKDRKREKREWNIVYLLVDGLFELLEVDAAINTRPMDIEENQDGRNALDPRQLVYNETKQCTEENRTD
jgi:hypothetical protein